MKSTKFTLNMAGFMVAPVGFFLATNRLAQLDAVYEAADAPGTPKDRSLALLRLAKGMREKMAKP